MQDVQYTTCIDLLDHLPGMHYLEVPQEIVQQLGGKLNSRLHCTVNRSVTFACGLMALGGGRAYISISAKRMKALGVRRGEEVSVILAEDHSPYGMEMPEELAELLRQDDEGNQRFHGLTPGKMRYVIFYVSSVKSTQLRVDRAVRLIGNLKKLPVGKESFRQMLGLE